MPQTNTPVVSHFDADTLKELRESARIYQKLDLTYVAAGGAIITALKISNGQLFEFAAQFWFLVYALLALLAIDTFVEQLIFSDWVAAKSQSTKRASQRTIDNALKAQPLLHFLFISVTVVGVIGYSQGITSARNELRGFAMIQEATDKYVAAAQKIPSSIDSLIAADPHLEYWVNKMDSKVFRFEANGKDGYRITYAGRDGSLGTKDDGVITSQHKLRPLVDSLEAGEWEAAPKSNATK